MPQTKRHGTKGYVLFIGVALVLLAVLLISVLRVLSAAYTFNRFKTELVALTGDPTLTVYAKDGETKTLIDRANLGPLYNLLTTNNTRVSVVSSALRDDTLVFTFVSEPEAPPRGTLTIRRTTSPVGVKLQAENTYEYYFKGPGSFEDYRRIASPEGWSQPNQKIEE